MDFLIYVFAILAGAMNVVQAGANAQLRKSLEQPFLAGISVYVTGFLGLLLILPFVNVGAFQWSKIQDTPWWAWCGGALSIASTMAGLMLARRLGSAGFTGITVTSSLLASVALDHFGWIGFQIHRVNPGRLIGCGLLVTGLILVTRF